MSRIILNQIALQKIKVISETKKYFLLQPSSAAAPSTSNYGITPPTYTQTGYSGWSDTEPSYTVGDERVLYELTETIYSDRTWNYSTPTISSSYKAAKEAYNKVIQAEEDIQDFVDLGLKQGYIWDNPTSKPASGTIPVYPAGSYIASGILSGGTRSINRSNSNTYGLNTWISTGGINLRYNAIDLMKLTTSNLFFYYPSTSTQQKKAISLGTNGTVNSLAFYGFNNDNKTMELTNNALTFYNPSNGVVPLATLNANGLVLSKGGITVDTVGSNDGMYISSENLGSAIPSLVPTPSSGTSKTNWRAVIGSKFGVDSEGNLYANEAHINGAITATSLTIGSGATVSGLSTSNINGMSNYALQSSLDSEITQRKAVYAVSTTGATTAAKTTESGTPSGFVLYNGATVTVKFNSANSTTTPTLNVNGTGAKTIKSYTGAALTAAEYTWPAGAAITFTYDGSYWRMQDSGALQAKADAAASASSASSSASAASSSASSASTSASSASNSATSASNSASTASTKATEASNSASTASSKASAASTSATNAANSASAASTSATNASNSADAAASSASDASDSADAAAGSASTASSKATAAANSATSASNSASSASSSATAASNSASSASSSATTATNKANAASTSATNAANSATAASGSATSAANSATAASNSATSASNSATAASKSATAAAEVMGGFTILWNYSAFGTATAGDTFICGFDPATGTKSDGNGWVKWNGTKRTITKQQVNPGTIVPYNIPIYIVCRLSSATATTGTNYMVWYNAGWKYAACPSPTAVGGSWTWTDNRDIILGSFVETGANEVLTECELFNPPWTSKQITTNTTTPTSYIMDTNSNKGIKVRPKDSSGNDFLQMNSDAIEFFKNSTTASAMRLTDNSFRLGLEAGNHTTINTNGLHIWAGTESTADNEVALFGSTTRIGKDINGHSRIFIDPSSSQSGITNIFRVVSKNNKDAHQIILDDHNLSNNVPVSIHTYYFADGIGSSSDPLTTTSRTSTPATFVIDEMDEIPNGQQFKIEVLLTTYKKSSKLSYGVPESCVFTFTKGSSETMNWGLDAFDTVLYTVKMEYTTPKTFKLTVTAELASATSGVSYWLSNSTICALYHTQQELVPVHKMHGDVYLHSGGLGRTYIGLESIINESVGQAVYGNDADLHNTLLSYGWTHGRASDFDLKELLYDLICTVPIGTIEMYGGSTLPTGWLFCYGQPVNRSTYSALFEVIGTSFGAGDGSTTFNLPDLSGRFPLGVGNGTAAGHTNHKLNDKGGNEDAIIPHHRHGHNGENAAASSANASHTHATGSGTHYMYRDTDGASSTRSAVGGSGKYTWTSGSASGFLSSTNTASASAAHSHSLAGYTAYAGSSNVPTTGANMPPYIGLRFIIYTGLNRKDSGDQIE